MAPAALATDPSRVPVYPVLRLQLRESGGVVDGLVDGSAVASGETRAVRGTVLAAAGVVAATRPCRAIRVRLEGFPEGPEGVVDAAGVLVDVPLAQPPRPRRRRGVLLGVAALVVIGVATAGLTWVTASAKGWSRSVSGQVATPVAPAPRPTQLPVVAPPGWSSVATWSRDVGTSGTTTIATSAGLVYVPSREGSSVVALDGATGRQVWSAAMPGSVMGSALTGGPIVADMSGHPIVVSWTSAQLAAWDPATGRGVGSWSLPSTISGVVGAGNNLLIVGQGQHVGVLAAGRLQWRVLAAGASGFGSTPAGDVIAAGDGRAWRTASDRVAGEAFPLTPPAGLAWAGVAGRAGEDLVVAYAASPDTVVLRAFSTVTWAPDWTTEPVPTAQLAGGGVGGSPTPLWVSPSSAWGLYGSTWIDLRSGSVTALPSDWSTSAIGASVAFGTTAGAVAAVTASGAFTPPADASASSAAAPSTAPVAVTDSGLALVVASDGSSTSLYAVPQVGH